MRSAGPVLAFLVFVVAACTGGAEGSVAPTEPSDDQTTTQETAVEACEPEVRPLTLTEAPATTPEGLIELSQAVYSCQSAAVVVQGEDIDTVRFAADTAMEQNVPLLRIQSPADRDAVVAELERLEVSEVISIGVDPALTSGLADSVTPQPVPTTTAPTTVPETTVAPQADEPTETSSSTADSAAVSEPETTSTTAAEASTTTIGGDETPTTTTSSTTTTAPPRFEPAIQEPAAAQEGPVVLYRRDAVVDAYLAVPAISAGGGEVAVTDLADVDAVRGLLGGRSNVFVGGDSPDPTEEWQIALATTDTELFGGGTRVFPDRRIIAYYGNPLTFRLGILGETDPERAVERVTERAALYNAEGLPPALPGFEIIATVASNRAGDDDNYSNEMDIETIRPWIDAARANDVSVILDLQPGRTDFVTQAKLYEEFLRLPNVGLALDPEWRLKPDQRHLRQIGTVGADEINAVIDYLTTLVHEETLPQKVLILHQFQERMLPDRELVKTPSEIAVVVHVDGQGSLGSKYGTWAAMLDAPTNPEQQLWWAWKNFIDEDFPTATPGQVNAVEPLPVIVTYQ
ncbi:MAG: hypothetical protein ACN4GZ_19055 [Acidimicrobiales bacterium]